VDVPVLKTERLLLRCPAMKDWPAYEQLMRSERAKYMGGPHSQSSAWGMFCSDIAQWDLLGHGALMFDSRVSGECLGQVGINRGPLFPELELGWFVYLEAEGKGYAYEAAFALRKWAFETKGFTTLVSYIDEGNLRSCRLAEKLGASLDPSAPRPEPNDLVYRHFSS